MIGGHGQRASGMLGVMQLTRKEHTRVHESEPKCVHLDGGG